MTAGSWNESRSGLDVRARRRARRAARRRSATSGTARRPAGATPPMTSMRNAQVAARTRRPPARSPPRWSRIMPQSVPEPTTSAVARHGQRSAEGSTIASADEERPSSRSPTPPSRPSPSRPSGQRRRFTSSRATASTSQRGQQGAGRVGRQVVVDELGLDALQQDQAGRRPSRAGTRTPGRARRRDHAPQDRRRQERRPGVEA